MTLELSAKQILSSLEQIISFFEEIIGPPVKAFAKTLADRINLYRLENLIKISERIEKIQKEKNVKREDIKHLSYKVGLPLLENASLEEQSDLQEKWAYLINYYTVDSHKGENNDFSLDRYYIDIFSQFSSLDCKLLEYMAKEKSIKKLSNEKKIRRRFVNMNEIQENNKQ